jgi:hypothetical protein
MVLASRGLAVEIGCGLSACEDGTPGVRFTGSRLPVVILVVSLKARVHHVELVILRVDLDFATSPQ